MHSQASAMDSLEGVSVLQRLASLVHERSG